VGQDGSLAHVGSSGKYLVTRPGSDWGQQNRLHLGQNRL